MSNLIMSNYAEKSMFLSMCRLCLIQNVELIGLYPTDELNTTNANNKIIEIIERFTTVKIHPLDNLPQKICGSCVQTIKSMLAFHNSCKRKAEELREMIEKSLDESRNVEEWSDAFKVRIVDDESEWKDENESENEEHGSEWKVECESENLNHDSELREEDQQDESGNVNESASAHESENLNESGNSVEILDDSETKQIVEVNVDQLESDNENALLNQQFNYPRRKPPLVACHICGKLYGKYIMKFHINQHNGVKPYKCDVEDCTSAFSGPRQLKVHKKECHLNPIWSCDVCGRAFTRNPAMKRHRRSHFDPEFPCKVCQKMFRTRPSLGKHMLVHTQERKFKCDTCRKSFQTRYTLRIHKRVHTQEKPYSCHCGVSFAYNCLLKAHTEKYHK